MIPFPADGRLAPVSIGLVALILTAATTRADGPKDNLPDQVRPIPPKGVPIPDADRKELQAGLAEFRKLLAELPTALKGKPDLLALLPDVEIYEKAVRYAVDYEEFFNPKEIPVAKQLLAQGMKRAAELKAGQPSWTTATGLVVRGYRSKIDGSVQPYGLVIPSSYSPTSPHRFRLDFWWHGRGETLSEVNFIQQRQTNPGQFTPRDTLVVHPYGRYCNANKFAGEIDTLECLEHVRSQYPIDENRITARGFSMGGAACWQFAVHYPTLWAAAAPGAGFSETPEFLKVFQKEEVKPQWWEERLWKMYNASDSAVNLFNLPTVAYSGENDPQKQAAEVMARELAKVGLELTHIIGPQTGHTYEKAAKAEIDRRIDAIVARGRNPVPERIKFATYTLRYNQCAWLKIEGLKQHWTPGYVEGEYDDGRFTLKTSGITALSIDLPPGAAEIEAIPSVSIDGQLVWTGVRKTDRSVHAKFRRGDDGRWQHVPTLEVNALVKRPGLQGPIDDAFLDRFIMVKPSGPPLNDAVGKWTAAEMDHAIRHWRSQFRGDAIVKADTAITEEDIASSHLILWGDPKSNAILAKIAGSLPLNWTSAGVTLGNQTYPAEQHVPVLIFPNPLNPTKYVVVNSGFTFREYDYLNNARQVPKLPDYAIIDITTPVNSRWPGKIVRAGFFGEKWEWLPNDGK